MTAKALEDLAQEQPRLPEAQPLSPEQMGQLQYMRENYAGAFDLNAGPNQEAYSGDEAYRDLALTAVDIYRQFEQKEILSGNLETYLLTHARDYLINGKIESYDVEQFGVADLRFLPGVEGGIAGAVNLDAMYMNEHGEPVSQNTIYIGLGELVKNGQMMTPRLYMELAHEMMHKMGVKSEDAYLLTLQYFQSIISRQDLSEDEKVWYNQVVKEAHEAMGTYNELLKRNSPSTDLPDLTPIDYNSFSNGLDQGLGVPTIPLYDPNLGVGNLVGGNGLTVDDYVNQQLNPGYTGVDSHRMPMEAGNYGGLPLAQ